MEFTKKFFGMMLTVALSAALAAAATPTVTLTPNIDPPSPGVGSPIVFQVSGANFPISTAVDIYFDLTDVALAVTSSTGAFSGINVQVPTTAAPGTHWVTGVARGTSGSSAQASFTVQTNWNQFHYSSLHKGRNPYENVLNGINVASIDVDWTFTTAGALTSSPAVSAGTVYVGSADDYLYAINATTGALVWKFKTGNSIVDSSPAVANNTVYIGSTDNSVYAVNATTGVQVWKFATSNTVLSSPAVAGGVVYVGSYDNSLYAINATSGAQVWKFATHGNFYAVNAKTGLQAWKFAGTTGTLFESSPAVSGGIVYVGSDAGFLYALNGHNGTLIWDIVAATPAVTGSPTIANGLQYVSIGSNAYAVQQVVTPNVLWAGTTGGVITGTPTVANGVVYVASQDFNLYAYDLTGGGQTKMGPPERPVPKMLQPNWELEPSTSH